MASANAAMKPFVTKFDGKAQLTSTEFMSTFRKFDKDGNGYIEARELDGFLFDLFEARYHGLATDKAKEFKELVLEKYDTNYDGRLEIYELAHILPTEQNFLLQFRLESKISSVGFMKIWNHYDVHREGFLERKQLRGFMHDLLSSGNPTVSPQRVEEFVSGTIQSFDSNHDGEIELAEMAKLLPVEDNFLEGFEIRKELTRSQFEKIWAHYDQDHNGAIGGAEIDALIRDLYIKTNKTPPDMKTISDQRDVIMRFVDRDGDEQVQKEELGMFFSVAQSKRVQDIKYDAEADQRERKAELETVRLEEERKKKEEEERKEKKDASKTTSCCMFL